MTSREHEIIWAVGTATARDATALAPALPTRRGTQASNSARSDQGAGLSAEWRSRPDDAQRDWVAGRLAERRATSSLSTGRPLSVSLAHSGGHAIAAAASHPARIGVDLEREDAIGPEHARYFLLAREQKQLGRLTLTELWALKEAAWKALGLDDTIPFTDLELLFDADGSPYAIRFGSMIRPIAAQLRAPWHGWVAAIVLVQGVAA